MCLFLIQSDCEKDVQTLFKGNKGRIFNEQMKTIMMRNVLITILSYACNIEHTAATIRTRQTFVVREHTTQEEQYCLSPVHLYFQKNISWKTTNVRNKIFFSIVTEQCNEKLFFCVCILHN